MKSQKFLRLLPIFYLLVSITSSLPAKDKSPPKPAKEVKKTDHGGGGIEDELLKLVQTELHLEYFDGDPILVQSVDTVNDRTTYKTPGTGNLGTVVYERKSNDLDKEFLILKPDEDKIPPKKTKNIYIGLRRARDDGNTYHPFFIYLRTPADKEEGAVNLDGQHKVLEFDTWVNREDRYQTLERRFGWDECSSSIFVPCKSSQLTGRVTPRQNKKSTRKLGKKAKPTKKKEDLEPNDSVGFFWDLDDGEDGGGQQTLFSPELAGEVATGNGELGGQAKGRGFLGGLLGGGGGNGCGGGGFLSGIFGGDNPCPVAYAAVPAAYAGAYPPGYGGYQGYQGYQGYPPAGYPGYPPPPPGYRGGYGGAGVGGVVRGVGGVVNDILDGKRRRRREVVAGGPTPSDVDLQVKQKIHFAVLKEVSDRLNNLIGEELLKTDLFTYPGWKTMEHAGAPNDTLLHELDAFVGFGTCVYKKVTKSDYDKAKTPEQVILVLAAALRTHCIDREITFYDSLLSMGYIQMNADKTFDLHTDNSYIKRNKLSLRRRSELSRAFETSLFSKAFKAELYDKNPHIAPPSHISRRVHVLGQTILEGIELALTTLKQHKIKLLRSLLLTANTGFMKLLQDYEGMRDCENCMLDLDINKADQVYLMTLLKFIVYGLEPVEKNTSAVPAAFEAFSKLHNELISERVDAYL